MKQRIRPHPYPDTPRLPRHRCRGLIEAGNPLGTSNCGTGFFRGIDAAASLKPHLLPGAGELGLEYLPRHRCRGLIEASRGRHGLRRSSSQRCYLYAFCVQVDRLDTDYLIDIITEYSATVFRINPSPSSGRVGVGDSTAFQKDPTLPSPKMGRERRDRTAGTQRPCGARGSTGASSRIW